MDLNFSREKWSKYIVETIVDGNELRVTVYFVRGIKTTSRKFMKTDKGILFARYNQNYFLID